MSSYVTLPELQNALDWDLDEGEQRTAQFALDTLSDDARFYGREWPENYVPRQVKNLILKVAAGWMRNPDGYNVSKAGDETVGWDGEGESKVPEFTETQIQQIRGLANRPTKSVIVTAPGTAWGPQAAYRYDGWADAGPTDRPFPFYPDGRW